MFDYTRSADRLVVICSLVATLGLALFVTARGIPDAPLRARDWGLHEVKRCAQDVSKPTAMRQAEALYRATDFAGAAETIRSYSTAERFARLADNYQALGDAFAVAIDPRAEVLDAYAALLVARKADLALHEAWLPQIENRLGTIASRAAVEHLKHRRFADAEVAVGHAEKFAGKSASTETIRRVLARAARTPR